MGASRYVHLDIDEILRETDQAFLCLLSDGDQVWLPKSQITDADNYEAGDLNVTMSVTEWIAREKGLSDE